VCQENEDIDSISFTSNVSNNEHDFFLDKNDLAQTTINENPMTHMKFIVDTNDEENNIIDEDGNDEIID